jgi:acetyl esterase
MVLSSLTALRQRAGALFVDNAFRGLATVSRLHPRARPERHGVRVTEDVSYGAAPWQKLDVWRPVERPAEGSPALLYVHGGGFRILSKDTHWVMALAFARAGYTVFNVDYRLAPRDPFPAAVEDVTAAYRWVVEHAGAYGADLDRLIVAGESAGANLSLVLAMCATFEHEHPLARAVFDTGVAPKAIAPMCGMYQVSDSQRFARRKRHLSSFVADRIEEVERSYLSGSGVRRGDPLLDLADPLLWLERESSQPRRALPPLFTTVGTRDPLVDDTRRLERAWRARGGLVEAHVVPGEVHAYHAFVWRPAARDAWARKHAFLRAALGAAPR